MQKHVFFWIGFFLACLISVVIAVGAWGVAERYALNLAAIFFGFILALTIVLIIVVFFWEKIIRKVFKTNQSTIDDVIQNAVKTVSSSVAGDRESAEIHSEKLLKSASSWYLWANFYRWVITTCVAIVLAFGAFTGTILLFEQNKKIEAQNKSLSQQTVDFSIQTELRKLALVDEFRKRLTRKPTLLPPKYSVQGSLDIRDKNEHCLASMDTSKKFYTIPNNSALLSIQRMAQNSNSASINMRAVVVEALQSLLHDSEPSAQLGALLILDNLNSLPKTTVDRPLEINRIALSNLQLANAIHVRVLNSAIQHLECPNCEFSVRNSIVDIRKAKSIIAENSFVRLSLLNFTKDHTPKTLIMNSLLTPVYFRKTVGGESEKILKKRVNYGSNFGLKLKGSTYKKSIIDSESKFVCPILMFFCEKNEFYSCSRSKLKG